MKKILALCLLAFFVLLCDKSLVRAEAGDMGFFGGITQGTRLPSTTELLLNENNVKKLPTSAMYKEITMLSGKPVELEGLLTVTVSGDTSGKDATVQQGSYKVTYNIVPSATTSEENRVTRRITFNVTWATIGNQTTKTFDVSSWNETLTIGGIAYQLDNKQSRFAASILQDKTAGVVYYKGDLSQKAVYLVEQSKTVLDTSGAIYGYSSAWSNTETHRINGQVKNDVWQLQYQVRPSVSVNKTLQYSQNEPTAISFSGNYREVMQNQSGLQYDISVLPRQFYDVQKTGGISIESFNEFEQLIAPDLSHLKGNFAEDDIRKLFSMKILEGETTWYKPEQAITRGEFVTMLVKAIKLPIDTSYQTAKTTAKKPVPINIVFPDVMPDRADYPYIMAAYGANLAVGRGTGHFHVDAPLYREEALVILLRALGLTNLGLEPTPITPYSDDANISEWAKKDIYAATRLQIILGDDKGNINPKVFITKAEAAALINRLIVYMRTDLQKDYSENIVHFGIKELIGQTTFGKIAVLK